MSHLAALKSGAGCDAGVQGVGRAVCFTRAPRGQGRSDALMRSCSTRKWTTACCTRSSGKARRRACCACNESVGARVGTVAALGGADTRPQPCCRSRSCLRCPRSRATYRSSTRRAPPANQTLPYSALSAHAALLDGEGGLGGVLLLYMGDALADAMVPDLGGGGGKASQARVLCPTRGPRAGGLCRRG